MKKSVFFEYDFYIITAQRAQTLLYIAKIQKYNVLKLPLA